MEACLTNSKCNGEFNSAFVNNKLIWAIDDTIVADLRAAQS